MTELLGTSQITSRPSPEHLAHCAQAGEVAVEATRELILYACRGKVEVDLPGLPDMRHYSDDGLMVEVRGQIEGAAAMEAVSGSPYPPSDPAVFLETVGLRYWRSLCRKHAAVCEMLKRVRA